MDMLTLLTLAAHQPRRAIQRGGFTSNLCCVHCWSRSTEGLRAMRGARTSNEIVGMLKVAAPGAGPSTCSACKQPMEYD